jgi:DNA-binding LacI/PurR family transcriptional regulator
MTATIREVAQRAGVSIKTVSNVINDHPYISVETRKKVTDAITELGYRPNRSAQALRSRRNIALAAIIPDIKNPFFTTVVRGIEDYAFDAGHMLLLCDSEDNVKRESQFIRVLGMGTVSGVVLCTADERILEQQIHTLQKSDISVVAIDRITETAPVDAVLAENFAGSYTGMKHLLDCGHRRIGIIAGPDYYAPGRERLEGCLKALEDAGVPVDESLIQRTDFKQVSSQAATRILLEKLDRPTAIFVSNGPSAYGTLEVVRALGLRFPQDIAIVVFDDPEWSRIVESPLTVIAQPGYEMGRLAAEMLLRRLDHPEAPLQCVRLPTTLIHRKSCC